MPEELKIDKIIEKMELKLLTPDIETGDKVVTVPDINRPALQLTGFFDHFDSERVQVIGHVEAAYMETLDEETRKDRYEQLMSYFIFTYFAGAVYDYEVESKLRFGLAAVLIIHELDMALWYKNGKKLTFDEQVWLVHNYSMEIEHSDLNLDDMERMVMREKASGYRRMLTVLMNWKR